MIWYLLPEMKLGGAERHVLNLASGLRKRGYPAGIACLFREGKLAPEVRKEKIPFVCLDAHESWGPSTVFQIYRWIRSNPIDILHTYLFGFHFYAGLPAKLCKVPVVLSSRREIPLWQKLRHRWIENAGNLFVDRVICCSDAVKSWTLQKERLQPEKVLTLYNGVDTEFFTPDQNGAGIRHEFGIPEKAPLIGTVANFSFEKGYPYLLDAAQKVLKFNQDARFLFVGSGPLEKEMKDGAQKIPGHERIIFAGSRSDIRELIGAMDIFVLASLIEGFPNVLLEALALEKPVIATRVGGIPELIHSAREGVLVPAKDSQALADMILLFLQKYDEARVFGLRGAGKIHESFTLDRMIDQYESLYLSLAEKKGLRLRKEKELSVLVKN